MFASAKGKQQKWVRQLQTREQCIDHIPYYLSGLSRAHFSDNPSRNSCIKNLARPLRISHNTPCMPPKFYISIVSIEIKNIP